MDSRKIIEAFAEYWFSGIDHMREVEYFLPYIDEGAEFSVPEGTFRGPEGFRLWYGSLKEMVKPYNKHELLKVEISPVKEGYSVETDLLIKTHIYGGGPMHIRTKEVWKIGITPEEQVVIYEYRIKEVEEI